MEETPRPRRALDEVLQRFINWDGDLAELPALSETIVRANLEDNMVAVEKMALALLEHEDGLPAYYVAQGYAWLSTCNGYHRVTFITEAAHHIVKAYDEQERLGFSRKELGEWTNLIWQHKDEANADAASELKAKASSPERKASDMAKHDDTADSKSDSKSNSKAASKPAPGISLPIRGSTAAPTTAVSDISATATSSSTITATVKQIQDTAKAKSGSLRAYGGGFGNVEPGKVIRSHRAKGGEAKKKGRIEEIFDKKGEDDKGVGG